MQPRRHLWLVPVVLVMLLFVSQPAQSGVHLWRITEAFSNADGTIQFIELTVCCGSAGGEIFLSGQHVRSLANDFIFPANLTMATANRHLLLATDGYAALPGAPARDHEIPANFFAVGAADTLTFAVYDTWNIAAGAIPTNGTSSLQKHQDDATDTPFVGVNSPTNLLETTGSVTVVSGPPAVPDGSGGSTPLTVATLAADGSSLRLSYDVATCTANAANHHVIYGQRSGLPAAPGGTFTPLGSLCNIGNAANYDWLAVPNPPDGLGLLWFHIVATDGANVEGSWGLDGLGNERRGPGTNGSSGICSTDKQITNTCGNP